MGAGGGSALAAVEQEAWRLEVQQNVGVQESRSIAHRIHFEVHALVNFININIKAGSTLRSVKYRS